MGFWERVKSNWRDGNAKMSLVMALLEIVLTLSFIGGIALLWAGIERGNTAMIVIGSILISAIAIFAIWFVIQIIKGVKNDKKDIERIRKQRQQKEM